MVQFIPCCSFVGTNVHVARSFATASVAQLGRTLLLTSHVAEDDSAVDAVSARMARLLSHSLDPTTPDTIVPGLYHRRLREALTTGTNAESPPPEITDAKGFKMLAMANLPLATSPIALSYARRCHGSVLIIAAGTTRLADIQATARQLRQAGGTLLGTVLSDAPSLLWSHGKWRG